MLSLVPLGPPPPPRFFLKLSSRSTPKDSGYQPSVLLPKMSLNCVSLDTTMSQQGREVDGDGWANAYS